MKSLGTQSWGHGCKEDAMRLVEGVGGRGAMGVKRANFYWSKNTLKQIIDDPLSPLSTTPYQPYLRPPITPYL